MSRRSRAARLQPGSRRTPGGLQPGCSLQQPTCRDQRGPEPSSSRGSSPGGRGVGCRAGRAGVVTAPNQISSQPAVEPLSAKGWRTGGAGRGGATEGGRAGRGVAAGCWQPLRPYAHAGRPDTDQPGPAWPGWRGATDLEGRWALGTGRRASERHSGWQDQTSAAQTAWLAGHADDPT